MHAARVLYSEIGREVERQGLNSVARRAHVSWQRKFQLLPRVLAAAAWPRAELPEVVQEEARFLVDAAAVDQSLSRGSNGNAHSVLWLLDLFERLERERAAPPAKQSH
jgi:phytoene synthase